MGIYTRLPIAAAICDSEDETFAWRGDPSASVTLLVPWRFRYMVVSDLLGFDWDYRKNGRDKHVAGTSLPRKHPNAGNYKVTADTSFAGMYVKSVSVKGIGAATQNGQENDYEAAELTVSYGMLPQRSFTENINYEVQSMTLPRMNFCWDDDTPLADGEEPVKMFRTVKITHVYNMVQEIPQWAANKIGMVNSDTITTSQGLVMEPETLLYEGCETGQTWTYTGSEGWSLTTSWSYNPNGWNKWFNNIREEWVEIHNINVVGNVEGTESHSYAGEVYKMYEPTPLKEAFGWEPNKETIEESTEEPGGESGNETGGTATEYQGSNTKNTWLALDDMIDWTQEIYGTATETINEWLRDFYQSQEDSGESDEQEGENNGETQTNENIGD